MMNRISIEITNQDFVNTDIAIAMILEAVAKDVRKNCAERLRIAFTQGTHVRRTIEVEYAGLVDYIIY